jgi:hypothetical protein
MRLGQLTPQVAHVAGRHERAPTLRDRLPDDILTFVFFEDHPG